MPLAAIAIGLFNQLIGVNAILYYLNDIFARAGFNKISGDLQAVVIGAANLAATMLAMSLIDRAGLASAAAAAVIVGAYGGPEFRWREVLLLAVGLTAGTVALFSYALGLPMQIWPW